MDGLEIMKTIKVLMIGNSFAVDAAHFTHNISLNSECILEVHVLYIGGCSLETHAKHINEEIYDYEYFINGESTGKYISLQQALSLDNFDYITLQQVSGLGGIKDSFYPYIKNLMKYVKIYQPKAEFVLHETWAYPSYSKHEDFSKYHNDHQTMLEKIHETYRDVARELDINKIIPSGDIIEAAICEYGEIFYRDDFHLNEKGRFLAALGFVYIFNKNKISNIYKAFETNENDIYNELAYRAVNNR